MEPRCNENLEKKGGGRGRRVQCGNPAITGREIKEFKTNGTKKSLRLKTNKQINKQINKTNYFFVYATIEGAGVEIMVCNLIKL